MRSFHLFVNPHSGGGAAAARGVQVAGLLRQAGASATVTYSPGVADCQRLVREAVRRGEVVVAVGGDGMVASVVGDVVRTGGTLGVVPAGRGNDFARQLGVPRDAPSVAAVLLNAPGRRVDVIEVGKHVVAGSVYAGIDSRASQYVEQATWLPARVQYPYAAVRAIATHRPTRYTVTIDGRQLVRNAYTVVVANSGYYGSGMHVAPAASIDDGLLDVVVIKAVSRLRLLTAMRRLYDGSHVLLDAIEVLTCRAITVRSQEPVTAYGDGERLGELPVTVRVVPAALEVLAGP